MSASTLRSRTGTRLVAIGALMAIVLILRPAGITGGREVTLRRRPRPRRKRPEPPVAGSCCRCRPTGGRRASRSSTSGS